MSKESSFFKQAQKQDVKRKERIDEAKKKVDQYLASKKNCLNSILKRNGDENELMSVNKLVNEYEGRRDLKPIKVVLDMDMFYAAVAVRDRPHLKDKPVAVGGNILISTDINSYHLILFMLS